MENDKTPGRMAVSRRDFLKLAALKRIHFKDSRSQATGVILLTVSGIKREKRIADSGQCAFFLRK